MAGFKSFASSLAKEKKQSFASKTRNLLVAVGLSAFVQGIYYYTVRAAGVIYMFEELRKKDAANSSRTRS